MRRIGAAVVIGLGLLLLVVTQSGVLRYAVLPRLEAMLNCEARSGRVTLTATGKLRIRNLRLGIEGIRGEARWFLDADRLDIEPEWSAFFTGGHFVRRLDLMRPTFRLSQSQDMALNVQALQPSGGGDMRQLPGVRIRDGVLEFGEHWPDGRYEVLARISAAGGISPSSDDPLVYDVRMDEHDAGGMGLSVRGHIDLRRVSGEVKLNDVDLAEWSLKTAPSRIQPLWEQMRLNGLVREATMKFDQENGPSVEFALEKVDMNIPVASPRAAGESDRAHELLSMRDVSGSIVLSREGLRASLDGLIEDLRCAVNLQMASLSPQSALRCEIRAQGFKVAERPQLLPFAPPVVHRLFARFSSPTAEVNGLVSLERGPPDASGRPGELRAAGKLEFRNGRAEYEKFRYPITGLGGTVTFDDKRVELLNITGKGPTGAKLLATGTISPPTDGAAVKIDVTVVDAPLDQHFRDALPPHRQAIFRELFSEEHYARLRSEGLVLSSADRPELEARRSALEADLARAESSALAEESERLRTELARIDRRLAAPVFEMGGVVDMDISVQREQGEGTEYTSRVEMRIDRGGLLVRAFPYPAVATECRVVITDDLAVIEPVRLAGLSGAEGTLEGRVEYTPGPGGTYHPHIAIKASGVPPDEYLAFALPDRRSASEFSPAGVLRALRPLGRVDVSATIERDAEGRLGYRVDAPLEGLTLRPRGPEELDHAARLELRDVRGRLSIVHGNVALENLTGSISPVTSDGAKSESHAAFRADIHSAMGGDSGSVGGADGASVEARAELSGVDLAWPLEDLVGAVAPEQGQAVAATRSSRSPEGISDMALTLRVDPARKDRAGLWYEVGFTPRSEVAFDLWESRVRVNHARGGIAITPTELKFSGFEADVRDADEDAAAAPVRVRMDGGLALGDGGVAGRPAIRLNAGIEAGRFESKVVRAMAGALFPSGAPAAKWMTEVDLRGEFDAAVQIDWRERAAGGEETTATSDPVYSGWVEPRSLTIRRRGREVAVDRLSGRIHVEPGGGRIEGVRAEAATWSLDVDGAWSERAPLVGDAPGLKAKFTLQAQGLSDELQAALPAGVEDALRGVSMKIEGPLAIEGGELGVARRDEGGTAVAFTGSMRFAVLAMEPGVSITDADGTAFIAYARPAGATEPEVRVEFEASRFKLAGIAMTDGRGTFESGKLPGVYALPQFTAQAHGGAFSARAAVGPVAEGKRYEVEASMSRVDFASLLAELMTSGGQEPVAAGERGVLDGALSLSGMIGDPSARRGRGLIRVQDGRVVDLPGVLPLLELSNLSLPSAEGLNFAYADYHIQGNEVVFDELNLESDSLVIHGAGVMTWPDMKLDLRVGTRARGRIPVISSVLEGVREELVTTVVEGTVYDPRFRLEQFSGTRHLLDTIIGGRRDAREEEPPAERGDGGGAS